MDMGTKARMLTKSLTAAGLSAKYAGQGHNGLLAAGPSFGQVSVKGTRISVTVIVGESFTTWFVPGGRRGETITAGASTLREVTEKVAAFVASVARTEKQELLGSVPQ